MYRFPETTFAATVPPHFQLEHVESECRELREAYLKEPAIDVAIEALDLIHSTETFLRGWCLRNGMDIALLHDLVVEKNRVRGYYR